MKFVNVEVGTSGRKALSLLLHLLRASDWRTVKDVGSVLITMSELWSEILSPEAL
jgi:hypothetical protein